MRAPSDPTVRPSSFARRNWGKLLVASVLLVPALVFGVWSAVALGFSYSDGNRVGYALKLSRRGWVCKTWEGELAMSSQPGQMPQVFRYSVRDDAVAREIQKYEGQQVALTYAEHPLLPTSCFGETEYFVTGVRAIPTAPMMYPVPVPPSAARRAFRGATAPGAPGAAPATSPATTSPAPAAPAAPAARPAPAPPPRARRRPRLLARPVPRPPRPARRRPRSASPARPRA
jgi:hypothetical protein